jgi:hypothetical protein
VTGPELRCISPRSSTETEQVLMAIDARVADRKHVSGADHPGHHRSPVVGQT